MSSTDHITPRMMVANNRVGEVNSPVFRHKIALYNKGAHFRIGGDGNNLFS